MTWKIERLSGTIDGANRDFTLSEIPVPATLSIFFTGIPLEPVGSQPDQMQYAYVVDGVDVELGLAPVSGQNPWARYFYEP